MQADDPSCVLHATCVEFAGRGLLILGTSGSGKSGLALQLMGYGAGLVADDRVLISRSADRVIAQAPSGLPDLIEARYMGLLKAKLSPATEISAIVDLDRGAGKRLPDLAVENLLGCDLPCFWRVDEAHFAAALIQYLKAGVLDPNASI